MKISIRPLLYLYLVSNERGGQPMPAPTVWAMFGEAF